MEASLPSGISVTAPLDNPTVLAEQFVSATVANEVAPIPGSEAAPWDKVVMWKPKCICRSRVQKYRNTTNKIIFFLSPQKKKKKKPNSNKGIFS